MEKTNACVKNNELTAILNEHFQGKINLARVKLMAHFICALCKVRTVAFEKLANAFESTARSGSSLRRIQRFIAGYALDSDLVARLVFSLLPEQGGLKLTIDRTNWKFGEADINIFMLGVVYQGVAFPLLFSMLGKRGNSSSGERIELVERFVRLFGKERIECLVADREFVGREWIGYLNGNGIRYHIRIRNNFKVWQPSKSREVKAFWLFNGLRAGEFKHYCKIVEINGQRCYLSGCKLEKGDFLIIVSFNRPEEAQGDYAQRWQIEMCFKAMKSSGFDIEATHLTDLARLEKLVLLVMVAFVWCYKVGIYLHRNVRPITVKKHGRKAKSIFKYGLDHVSNVLLNNLNQNIMNITRFLSCT
jgi:hypothetical protein